MNETWKVLHFSPCACSDACHHCDGNGQLHGMGLHMVQCVSILSKENVWNRLIWEGAYVIMSCLVLFLITPLHFWWMWFSCLENYFTGLNPKINKLYQTSHEDGEWVLCKVAYITVVIYWCCDVLIMWAYYMSFSVPEHDYWISRTLGKMWSLGTPPLFKPEFIMLRVKWSVSCHYCLLC